MDDCNPQHDIHRQKLSFTVFILVFQQGKRSTESFLRYYVVKNEPPLKESVKAKESPTVKSEEAPDSAPVNGNAVQVNNVITVGEDKNERVNEVKADINVTGNNGDSIIANVGETKEDKTDMREEQEKLDDSSRISFDEPNPLDSSKQPLLNESSEKT